MSEPKIVEAVGSGRVNLLKAIEQLSTGNRQRMSVAKVRVQKVRDGKVYEDTTLEFERNGFHG